MNTYWTICVSDETANYGDNINERCYPWRVGTIGVNYHALNDKNEMDMDDNASVSQYRIELGKNTFTNFVDALMIYNDFVKTKTVALMDRIHELDKVWTENQREIIANMESLSRILYKGAVLIAFSTKSEDYPFVGDTCDVHFISYRHGTGIHFSYHENEILNMLEKNDYPEELTRYFTDDEFVELKEVLRQFVS